MSDASEVAPSLEAVLEAAQTLQLVREHVSGFGTLMLTEKIKRGRGRVLEASLRIHGRHGRFVKDELREVIQPAADLISGALEANWRLSIETEQFDAIRITIRT